jgi:hypothetical protein
MLFQLRLNPWVLLPGVAVCNQTKFIVLEGLAVDLPENFNHSMPRGKSRLMPGGRDWL